MKDYTIIDVLPIYYLPKKLFSLPNFFKYSVIILIFYSNAYAKAADFNKFNLLQKIDTTVSGTVRDAENKIISGVTVSVKSKPSVATSTNLNGQFVLNVVSTDILVFRMIGYKTVESPVNDQKAFNVIMETEDDANVEEVVVTAFGQRQKKSDLIGSVASLTPKELRSPSSNLTAALQGKVAGVVAFQRNGEPGADNADFFIRGVGTFGTNNRPLILIDNMEVTADDLARIPVDDIETFSVLRDATAAAVYGSRGANGVLIVTTKIGKEGPASFSFRAEERISTPTQSMSFADPVTWMKMYNEAILTRDPLGSEGYSQYKIDKTAEGNDPLNFPSVNWLNILTKPTTRTQNYNIGVNGGGQIATYNVSANYTNDNGLLRMNTLNNFNNNVNFKVINLRSNVGINLTKSTFLMVRSVVNLQNYDGPPVSGSEVYNSALRANPVLFQPVYQPGQTQSYIKHPMYGNADVGQYNNPYANIMKGYSERRRSDIQAQVEVKQNLSEILFEGLEFRSMINVSRNSYFTQSRQYRPFYYSISSIDATGSPLLQAINPELGTEYLDFVPGSRDQSATYYFENQFIYNRIFADKHSVFATVINTIRDKVSTPVDNTISLISTLPNRNVSLSGKFTYGFDSRYHAEFAFGYNGSEKFSEKFRWGFFPSIGVAWTVSNESFFESLKPLISNFRLKATHGILGNDNINNNTRFFYLSDVNLSNLASSYRFGLIGETSFKTVPGVIVNRYANPDIRWEIAKMTNLGIELGLFNGALNFTGDFYKQFRDNIVQQRSLSSINGLTAGVFANVGEYKSRGFDGELSFMKNVNSNLWLQGRGTFTIANGEYVFYEEPIYKNSYRARIGSSSTHQFGYIAERLFIDDQEVLNSPEQALGSTVRGGDIKYLDVNRDGVINDDDRMPIGHPTTPEINFGLGLSTGYKGLEFSFFFSGIGRTSLFINPTTLNNDTNKGIAPFGNVNSPNAVIQAWADNYWSEDTKNIYAAWPRLSLAPQANNVQNSTFWMRNGSLIRLKQVELGYTLNKNFTQRYKVKTLRIYASATNLLTFSSFKIWDPEMGGNGLNYPLQRVFNLGLTLNL